MARKIFIGDIHWCWDELQILLKRLNVSEQDELYFTWDYFTKGPKPVEVAQTILNCKAKVYWVQGNQDLVLREILEGKRPLGSLEGNLEIVEWFKANPEALRWFQNLPLILERDDFILVHAWIDPSKPLDQQDVETLVTVRDWWKGYTWSKTVVFGHDAAQGLVRTQNVIWIDTGCVYGAYLTGVVWESGEIYQVTALDYYTLADKQKRRQRILLKET